MKLTGENRSTRRKTCPSATLSTTDPTWTDPGSKSVLRGGRPVANRLNHGMTLTTLFLGLLMNQSCSLMLLESDSGACCLHTETACSKFPLENPCSCWVIFVVSIRFPTLKASQQNIFMGWGQPYAQAPTWRCRVSFFVWVITLDLCGMRGPTSSNATTSIVPRIIWLRRLHHYIKVGIPSMGRYLSTDLSMLSGAEDDSNDITLMKRWEVSVMASTSFSQLFLHFTTLGEC
jgi:hypothetical protein